jgi:cellulose synthase operon protein C
MLASCFGGSYVESIRSLNYKNEGDGYGVAKTEKQDIDKTKDKIIQYKQFAYLFEVISSDEMRGEGMQGLMELEFNSGKLSDNKNITLNDVVLLFDKLLKKYPDQLNDRLLYQLAKAYEENDQENKELEVLDRLIKLFPESKYIVNVNYRRGEILFYKQHYKKAALAYQAVIKNGDNSELYEQSIYRLGWTQFKLNLYESAVSSFLILMDRRLVDGVLDIQLMDEKNRMFVEDSFRAISLSFSYRAGAYSAADYFDKHKKRSYENLVFKYMAKFYMQKKRYLEAVNSYKIFVKRNSGHEDSPVFMRNVIDIYKQGGFSGSLIAAKIEFVQNYSAKSKFWIGKDFSEHKFVINALYDNLLELVNYYHARAQKTHTIRNYRESQRWYRTFLSSFPKDKKAANMSFLFAELLFEDKKYSEAVSQYEHSAYDFPVHDKSSEAAYAALLAYIQNEKKLKSKAKSEWHQRFINSSLRFVNRYPGHIQSNNVLIQVAENLYNIGDFKKSYIAAKNIMTSSKSAKHKKSALILLASIEYEWADYKNAEISYKEVLKYIPKKSKEYKNVLSKHALTVYKQGEASKQKGNLKLAVKHFSRVKSLQPGASIVANAEYDAAATLISMRDWFKAAVVLESLRKTHPKHKLQTEVTKKLAMVYMEAGYIHKAASEYERISKFPGSSDYQLEALWQSAELFEQANDLKHAKKVYKNFNKRFSSNINRAIEARQRLIDMYQRERNYKSANYWRKQIVIADKKAGKNTTERMHYLAAKASFSLAEPKYESYMKSKLIAPLKKSLITKKKKMLKAIKVFNQAAAYNVPEVLTAATFRIAEIYQDLGFAIYHSERPKELNEEELEQYDVLIEDLAFPFEDKAIEFHEINIKRISEGYFDVWVKKSLSHLKELLPVRYTKEERGYRVVEEIL